MPEHDDKGEYNNRMPKPVPVPNCNGYPNVHANTQTVKKRGTGAATKGTKCSPRLA
jgi:hypothetical protein